MRLNFYVTGENDAFECLYSLAKPLRDLANRMGLRLRSYLAVTPTLQWEQLLLGVVAIDVDEEQEKSISAK